MKICILITKGNLGGAQRYVALLSTSLALAGHNITVAHGEGNILEEKLARKDRLTVVKLKNYSNTSFFADFRAMHWLNRSLNRKAFDLVIFNSSKTLIIAWFLTVINNKQKLVYVSHGFPWLPSDKSYKKKLKALIFYFLVSRIPRVISVSKYVETEMRNSLRSNQKIETILNTISPEHYSEISNHLASRPPVTPELVSFFINGFNVPVRPAAPCIRAITLGELIPNKGIIEMCLALSTISNFIKGTFKWEIFGDGVQKEEIEIIISRYGMEDIIELKGFSSTVSHDLTAYDLLLIPSINEAFGMVALEATANGVFVIANNVGGIAEAIISEFHGVALQGHNEIASLIGRLTEAKICPVPPFLASEYWHDRHELWVKRHINFLMSAPTSRIE